LSYKLSYIDVLRRTVHVGLIISPPGSDVDVLFFKLYLFQREISAMPRPIGVKFCMVMSTRPNFLMPVQNFGGGWHPKNNLGAKNMQNLARFQATSKFGGEYLRNGWRYSKSDKYTLYHDSSRVRRKKFGELWSTNHGD